MRSSALALALLGASTTAAISLGRAPAAVAAVSRARPAILAVSSPPSAEASVKQGYAEDISSERPLHVLIAGAGVGGLSLANYLHFAATRDGMPVTYTVLERTTAFKRFGGPIQLASNALRQFQAIDLGLFSQVEALATWTGNRTNGIKDGVRDEWYARFDLKSPAEARGMPYTCVVDRPDLQEILLERTRGNVKNGAAIATYTADEDGVLVKLENGETVRGVVLLGADGISLAATELRL